MKLYCPKCDSEKVSIEEQNPQRVSMDDYATLLHTLLVEKRTVVIECQNCGYVKELS